MKETKTSRSTVFALKGSILSENGANMVRNVFLIFIHDKLSINEVRIKVTQASEESMGASKFDDSNVLLLSLLQ